MQGISLQSKSSQSVRLSRSLSMPSAHSPSMAVASPHSGSSLSIRSSQLSSMPLKQSSGARSPVHWPSMHRSLIVQVVSSSHDVSSGRNSEKHKPERSQVSLVHGLKSVQKLL